MAENVTPPSKAEFLKDARKIEVPENVLLTESASEPLGAEGVVLLSLPLITENRVGLVDVLELGLRRLFAFVSVGVIFHGQLAVRFLDFLLSCRSGDFENLVIVFALHGILKGNKDSFCIKILITSIGQVNVSTARVLTFFG